MTNTKNDIPIYAEEITIENEKSTQTDLKASDILKTKTPIPNNFVELEITEGNYIRTTNNKWTKPLCERYDFSYEDGKKWVTLDIPHYLMYRLGLTKKKDISNPVYIDPKVLKRDAEFGGITIEDEKEIHVEKNLAEEEEEKIKSKGRRINELEKELEKLKQDNQLKSQENYKELTEKKDKESKQAKEKIEKLELELKQSKNEISGLKSVIEDKERTVELQKDLAEKKNKKIIELERERDGLTKTLHTTVKQKEAEINGLLGEIRELEERSKKLSKN